MEIIGKFIEFGLGTEVSRGTARTVAEAWIKNVSVGIFEKADYAVDEQSHGALEDADSRRVVKKHAEGDVEGILTANALGYLLLNIYGADTETLLTTGVYSHAFSLAQNIQHPSLSLFVKDGSVQQRVFKNGMINSLEIKASVDDFVRFTAGFIAGEGAANSDTPAYETDYDWIAKDITVKTADSEAGLAAASAVKVKDVSIAWDAGLIVDHVVGGYYPDDIYNAKMGIAVKFSKNFDDATFENLSLNDSAKYVQITIEGTTDLGGGNKPKLVILLNKAMVTSWDRGGGANDLVTENVELKAYYNSTDEQQSEATLVNTTSEFDVAST
jgi:hypothetical protein